MRKILIGLLLIVTVVYFTVIVFWSTNNNNNNNNNNNSVLTRKGKPNLDNNLNVDVVKSEEVFKGNVTDVTLKNEVERLRNEIYAQHKQLKEKDKKISELNNAITDVQKAIKEREEFLRNRANDEKNALLLQHREELEQQQKELNKKSEVKVPAVGLQQVVSAVIVVHRSLIHAHACLLALISSLQTAHVEHYEILMIQTASTEETSQEHDAFGSLHWDHVTLIDNNSGRSLKLAEAYNLGVQSSKGDYVILLDDGVEIGRSFVINAIESIKRNDASVVGGKISRPDGTLYHCWFEAAIDGSDVVPVHHLQGFPSYSAPIADKEVLGVAALAIMGNGTILRNNDFDSKYNFAIFDFDRCLGLRKLKLKTFYCSSCEAICHAEVDGQLVGSDWKWTPGDVEVFNKKYGPVLLQMIKKKLLVNSVVMWNMECGLGPVLGMTTEALNFLVALESKVKLVASVGNNRQCLRDVVNSFPSHIASVLGRALRRNIHEDDNIIHVVHRDPGRYSYFVYLTPLNHKGKIVSIGRSMFECDGVPNNWVLPASSLVNEIWVPSKFNVETFKSSNVRNKFRVLPELIDVNVWNPTRIAPAQLPRCGKFDRPFRFLSVFKWEARKGWDVLLDSYLNSFSSADPVCLYIKTHLSSTEEMDGFMKKVAAEKGVNVKSLAPVVLIQPSGFLPESKLPSIYKAVDAFVLPTHGEGWGLPIMEAMAMGLPTIVTGWGGTTEFANQNNAFLINITGLEPSSLEKNLKWAMPSGDHLKELMLRIYNNKAEATTVGDLARLSIAQNFSHQAVAKIAVQYLQDVEVEMEKTTTPTTPTTKPATTKAAVTMTEKQVAAEQVKQQEPEVAEEAKVVPPAQLQKQDNGFEEELQQSQQMQKVQQKQQQQLQQQQQPIQQLQQPIQQQQQMQDQDNEFEEEQQQPIQQQQQYEQRLQQQINKQERQKQKNRRSEENDQEPSTDDEFNNNKNINEFVDKETEQILDEVENELQGGSDPSQFLEDES